MFCRMKSENRCQRFKATNNNAERAKTSKTPKFIDTSPEAMYAIIAAELK